MIASGLSKGDTAVRSSRAWSAGPSDPDYATLRSKYAKYSGDVRATYPRFPCDWFWTWLTGKARASGVPRAPIATLLSVPQLLCQIAFAYCIIVGSILAAVRAESTVVTVLAWVMVVNRTRGLLHTFHYTSHGAGIRDTGLARRLATYLMSMPILHLTWDEYRRIHARDHHSPIKLSTDDDPDQQFMTAHGFRAEMTARRFWFTLVLAPFHPARVWDHIAFRLRHNFVIPPRREVLPRVCFWGLLIASSAHFGFGRALLVYYLFPLLILTQYSSYLQHVTEHVWYAVRPPDVPRPVHMASLTWGRFQGRPYPGPSTTGDTGMRLVIKRGAWFLVLLLADLPIRVFSFMQDLPSHDFHHRSPRVNFWAITTERANAEARLSAFGPMTETWGTIESLLLLRDNLVHGDKDPFGIRIWWRRRQAGHEAAAAE